jgi:chitin disaccharide deacetylase
VSGFADAEEIRLIVRGDDFGMTQGSLPAFERGFKDGILTCGSLLVNAPWFEGAANLIRKNPTWCVGVHLSLVGEWIGYRWRPVLPWDKVSSLVDEDGFLYTHPAELFRRKPEIEEIDKELRAQINLALKKGIEIQYLDTHYMGLDDYPGLKEVIIKIGKDYRLPISFQIGEKRIPGIYKVPVQKKKETALQILEGLEPGLWIWVVHLGIQSPEQDALIHTAVEDRFTDGGVGRHRAEELNVITSEEVKSLIRKKGIKLTNYKEFTLKSVAR